MRIEEMPLERRWMSERKGLAPREVMWSRSGYVARLAWWEGGER
jgi:hypothetical protein